MPEYVVVDEHNHWLYAGEADNELEALQEAKASDLYDLNADIYVYEVTKQTEYPAYLHATLKPEDIEAILKEEKKQKLTG
jgi:hypothetical protein